MRSAPTRAVAAFLLILSLYFLPFRQIAAGSIVSSFPETAGSRSQWLGPSTLGTSVRKMIAGRAACLEANVDQAGHIKDRDPNQPLTVLDSDSNPSHTTPAGLKIVLRSTTQLLGFPRAVDAFKRAAARWEAVVQNQVTVVIDVDFGPNLFGKPFDDSLVAMTDAQVLGGNSLYPAVRARLISEAYTSDKASLYGSLPLNTVPTDFGESAAVTASSASLRALELINPNSDPNGEASSFGLPPAIGLNSRFTFDFDSGDGIASDALDFESLAIHEIGHILGFISFVGQPEVTPDLDVQPSIWDLFRVRPTSIGGNFATAQRVLSSGGDQNFYAGDTTMLLSTGRPDGTGGDGKQASHWKDDRLTGKYLGVMEPAIGPGERQGITENDLSVLDAIGYRVADVSATFLQPLTSGQPQTGGMIAPPSGFGVVSHTQYSIIVPTGATRLKIDLNGDQNVDLFARFGQRVFIQGFIPQSDYFSATDSGSETINITAASSPPLRRGTYYIAVANNGPSETIFTVTATVTASPANHPPAIFNIGSHLEGDLLELNYAAIDLDGDLASAEVNLLDQTGLPLKQPARFAIHTDGSSRLEAQLSIGGLDTVPTAVGARLVLTDRDGNRSSEAIVDFSRAETGGLSLIGASFDGSRLTVNTRGVAESLEVEINGRIVAPPRGIKVKGSGNKLTVKGDAGQLGLQHGANRIRVKNGAGWSSIFILNF